MLSSSDVLDAMVNLELPRVVVDAVAQRLYGDSVSVAHLPVVLTEAGVGSQDVPRIQTEAVSVSV
jgi:hypothetical protein